MRLQDFKVVYICPDHNDKYHARKVHMETLLMDLGFKDVVHYKSGTYSYPKCLNDATVDILTTYRYEPILVLEDDVEFTGISEFEFVHGADAIYFGVSRCAGHPTLNKNEGVCVFKPYSETQVRVLNMLSAHAILYITSQYKEAVCEKLRSTNGFNDIAMSRIQPLYRILANKTPSFFQSAKFNAPDHNEAYTRFKLEGRIQSLDEPPIYWFIKR
jgi:hypothetical protein